MTADSIVGKRLPQDCAFSKWEKVDDLRVSTMPTNPAKSWSFVCRQHSPRPARARFLTRPGLSSGSGTLPRYCCCHRPTGSANEHPLPAQTQKPDRKIITVEEPASTDNGITSAGNSRSDELPGAPLHSAPAANIMIGGNRDLETAAIATSHPLVTRLQHPAPPLLAVSCRAPDRHRVASFGVATSIRAIMPRTRWRPASTARRQAFLNRSCGLADRGSH